MNNFDDWLTDLDLTAGPVKRSVTIRGHSTSISLEPVFWEALRGLAGAQGLSIAGLIAKVDAQRSDNGLPSALRQLVFACATSAQAPALSDRPADLQ